MSLVRVSIGNLVERILIGGMPRPIALGILNSASYRKGKRMIAALGGAAELTDEGRKILKAFGATEFEGKDARFVIDDEHLEEVMGLFVNRHYQPALFETDPTREIFEELVQEKITGMGPILTEEMAAQTKVVYRRTVRQKPPEGEGTSAREKQGMPTRRLFHLFDLLMPEDVYSRMRMHESVFFLTPTDLATTGGGTRKGRHDDQTEIADNIGLE